jgi:hypothetical protein
MKNVFKVLGVIALVTVIGFGFVSCGDGSGGGGGGGGGSGGTLKIINNNSNAITKVKVHYSGDTSRSDDEFTVNIANGGTWTQAITFSTPGMGLSVTVYFGTTYASKSGTLMKGETDTYTLDASGDLQSTD